MDKPDWTPADGVALRSFLNKTGKIKLKEQFDKACPATITAEKALEANDSQLAKLAAMKAGWDGAFDFLIELATPGEDSSLDAGFQDMR